MSEDSISVASGYSDASDEAKEAVSQAIEDQERTRQIALQNQQHQMLMQHVTDISKAPAYFASAFSVYVTQTGQLRISAGEQLHPAAPPSFYTAFATTLEGAEGLLDLLSKTIQNVKDEQRRRAEFDQTAGHG